MSILTSKALQRNGYSTRQIYHSIDISNAKCMCNIYNYGHDIYMSFRYISDTVMDSIEQLYNIANIKYPGKLRCKITNVPFIGINGKAIHVSDLIDRNIEGIPDISFSINTGLDNIPKMHVKMNAFLVDSMDLSAIEKLRIKATELYSTQDVVLFESKLDIIRRKYYASDKIYEAEDIPCVHIPYVEVPQSVIR